MIIHVVKPSDSVYSISKLYGVPSAKIIRDNGLTNPEKLVVGQSLVIDDGKYSKLGPIEVNGYAFPETRTDVLRRTLPDLTYFSIFSYKVKADGSLTPINDDNLITLSRSFKTAPMMVITNLSESGGFNSQIAHSILTDTNAQQQLLNNVLSTMKQKNYYGLDIDFEYIFPYDRQNYNNFIKKVSETIRPQGYKLTTALAPKTSSDQKGLLYEAHDYNFHGLYVDHVILMTYEWGYTYGPPKAVAPLNEVEKVISYAVTQIPSKKILMGIPNYGYDWTLPYVQGTAAEVVSNVGAVRLAADKFARIQFDAKAQSPYFNYYDSSKKQHEVWFEDARSIKAKLDLVNKYKLGGVSYWTIGRYFPQNWVILNSMYNIVKVL